MATATAMTTTMTTTTMTATTTTTTAAATAMAAAAATAIAGPQTTINLSYRNGYVELDTTKMCCGEDYEEATTTGEPCLEEDCPEGQTCWADVERYSLGAEEEGEESDED
jgi:cobalamin biosynthesis protein CbiD